MGHSGAVSIQLFCGDCLDILPTLEANSVDLIATDPPYFKVKMDQAWDRQWATVAEYLDWIGRLCDQWQRILRPNGSLYVFASPDMAARVECKIAERFNVLNSIVWRKTDGTYNEGGLWSRSDKDTLRSYFPQSERIIFAEHYGADNIAKGEAGYAAKCDQLRGFVFEPLRAYLADEWTRAGLRFEQANEACNTASMAARHFFSRSQWCLPTEPHYHALRAYANSHNHGGEYLRRDYEDLRRDYEDLRRDYEDLRRPFYATTERPYTDVWTFPTVPAGRGKHPCEKPLAMMEHIILTSSKLGAVVLDCCMGSGVTGEAANKHGRDFIGVESDAAWHTRAGQRIEQAQAQLALPGVT